MEITTGVYNEQSSQVLSKRCLQLYRLETGYVLRNRQVGTIRHFLRLVHMQDQQMTKNEAEVRCETDVIVLEQGLDRACPLAFINAYD